MTQRILDFHTHIYPEKIAAKAAKNIGVFYDIPMDFDGTAQHLREVQDRAGVELCLVHSAATAPAQVAVINDFIAEEVEKSQGKFIGYGTAHPDMTEKELEAEFIRMKNQLNLRGIKLHPDFQKFNIDDKNAYKIYEIAEAMNMPVLFHTGDKRWHFSDPGRLATVLKSFPRLIAIGAHFGGWSEWDKGERYLADKENVYVDTSSSFYDITPEKAMEYINAFGEDRVLFGSDYPMWDAAKELEFFDRLDLTEGQRRKILWDNGAGLLGIK